MEIVLASASPRRRELLSLITEHFTVCPADADETLRDAPLGEEVTRLSRLKAEAVQAQYPNAVCIGSDTMVTIDGLRLGKPKDADEAASMLRRLRGRTHEVLTGLAVLTPNGGAHTLHTCASPSAILRRTSLPPTLPPESRSTRPAPTASRATAHCSSRASRATITASWVCLWLRFIPFCAIFMRCKPHLPAEIPHFSATL